MEGYVEQTKESGYSKSYISTNLSAIRFFYDQRGKDSSKLPSNKELGADPRTKEDRIGSDRSWTDVEVDRFIDLANEAGHERFHFMDCVIHTPKRGMPISSTLDLMKNKQNSVLQGNLGIFVLKSRRLI